MTVSYHPGSGYRIRAGSDEFFTNSMTAFGYLVRNGISPTAARAVLAAAHSRPTVEFTL